MSGPFRQRIVLAKRETVYGTDAVPTGADNAIQTSEQNVTPLEGQDIDRGLLYPSFGASPDLLVGTHVACEYAVEIAGAGAAGTVPGYGALLRACGMSETINGGVSVVYDPVTLNPDSITEYYHMGATLHKQLGSRGNFRLEFPAMGVPHYMFRFLGMWVAPAGAALPTADFSDFLIPSEVNKANTPTVLVDGYAAILRSASLDYGNRVVYRNRPNSEEVLITDRQGSGEIVIQAPALATKNFFALAGSMVPLQIIHGVGGGKIVQIDAPKVQLKRPTYDEDEGQTMLKIPVKLTRNAGDDDIKITVK
jgi:hypothetical protein